MSVLIKGMEMPKSCFNCRCPRACQAINRRIDEMDRTEWFPQDHRHSDCPLIEVPEPHGRLIAEADAIETAWMILQGLGYRIGENQQLEESVREVFATAPAIEVE